MNQNLYILLWWANDDRRWILLCIFFFLPYGILTLPKSMKRYGNKLYGKQPKTLNRQERFANLSYFSDLRLRQFAVAAGILCCFFWFDLPLFGLFMAFGITIVYSIILFLYYFRWTDKGYKFQEEEKKKKEEKEQKKKEEDEARKKKYL
ncbi:MAG TPA: hypothetical protein VNG53_04555 [Bacteroidia bacterium]|nr:hypothetical protein [Bacteroidia bacterium]